MDVFQIVPVLGLAAFAVFVAGRLSGSIRVTWVLPAAVSAAFLVFSIVVVLSEGPVGFWPNQTQDGWGNQVWLDLLMAVAMSLVFLVPRARALGMNVTLWVLFVCATASIGLFAMLARVMYLSEGRAASGVSDPV